MDCLEMHADVPQKERQRRLAMFAAEPSAILVATDVAARGLNIRDTQYVINADMPSSVEVCHPLWSCAIHCEIVPPIFSWGGVCNPGFHAQWRCAVSFAAVPSIWKYALCCAPCHPPCRYAVKLCAPLWS